MIALILTLLLAFAGPHEDNKRKVLGLIGIGDEDPIMAATINITPSDLTGYDDGDAVNATVLQALGFTTGGFAGTAPTFGTITGGRKITIPVSSSMQPWVKGSADTRALAYYGFSCLIKVVPVDGQTWDPHIWKVVNQGNALVQTIETRANAGWDSDEDVLRFRNRVDSDPGGHIAWFNDQTKNERLMAENQPFRFATGFYQNASDDNDSLVWSSVDGVITSAAKVDIKQTTGLDSTSLTRPFFQSDTHFIIEIHITDDDPILAYTTDPRDEAEFTNYSAGTYDELWRPFYSPYFGAWDVTLSDAAGTIKSDLYATGTNVARSRAIVSSGVGETATFALRSAHAITVQSFNGTAPLRIPCVYLPGGGSVIYEIGENDTNPVRIRVADNGDIFFDPRTGSFEDTGMSMAIANRNELVLFYRNGVNQTTLMYHDLTESTANTARGDGWTSDWDGTIPTTIGHFEAVVTFGSSNIEFEGIYQPPQYQTRGIDSWSATSATPAEGTAMVSPAHMSLTAGNCDIQPYAYPQTFGLDVVNPIGRSGHDLRYTTSEMGGMFDAMRGSQYIIQGWQANPSSDRWGTAFMQPKITAFIDELIAHGVEPVLVTTVAVDDDPADQQDDIKANNAFALAYLPSTAGQGVRVGYIDIASTYTDVEAAATSDDNLHTNTEYDKVIGDQMDSMGITWVSGGNRSRDRGRDR